MFPRSRAVLRTSPRTVRWVGFLTKLSHFSQNSLIDWKDMDATCSWQCKPQEEDKYCVGTGTDMFMQGFAVREEGNFHQILTFICKVGQ